MKRLKVSRIMNVHGFRACLAAVLGMLVLAAALVSGCAQGSPQGAGDPPGTERPSEGSPSGGAPDSGGASAGAQGAPAEVAPLLYVAPGDAPKDLDAALLAINAQLAEDGVGIALQLQYTPWDAWDQKINLMLSTGEKFDMFEVMNDRVSLSNYASRNALADLTGLIGEYGANIAAHNPQLAMDSVTIDGKLYAIPAFWFESATNPEITIRTDILEKYGQPLPATFDELTEVFEHVMGEWEGARKPYIGLSAGGNTLFFNIAEKAYDEWPFVVYDKVFFVAQDGSVANYYETDVFRKNAANAKLWYDKGLISPDTISLVVGTSGDLEKQRLEAGDWLVHAGTLSDINPLKANYPEITADDFQSLDFAPEKPRVRPYGTRNMNAVPAASEHPDAAVKFHNWLLDSQDHYDLFFYGRAGIDYNPVGERSRELIVDPSTNQPPYFFSDWMSGNIAFIRTASTMPKVTAQTLYTLNGSAVDGYASSFTFNAESVQTQFTDVQTAITAVMAPIALGVQDYGSNIGAALDELRAAGVDELVAEFKRQLEGSMR